MELEFTEQVQMVYETLNNINIAIFIIPQKHPLLPALGSGQISTRTYGDKYTYLVG